MCPGKNTHGQTRQTQTDRHTHTITHIYGACLIKGSSERYRRELYIIAR